MDFHEYRKEGITNAGTEKNKVRIAITLIILIAAIVAAVLTPTVLRRAQIRSQYEIAMQYLNDLDYESAILAFTKILEIDPNNIEARNALQGLYLTFIRAEWESGNFQRAQMLASDMQKALGLTERLTP